MRLILALFAGCSGLIVAIWYALGQPVAMPAAPIKAGDKLYCLSYADQWYVNVFGFLEDRRLAHWLNRIFNFGLAIVLLGLIGWAAHVIVGEIAHAQLLGRLSLALRPRRQSEDP